MRSWIVVAGLVASAMLPARCWAWGCTGHQVVAYIAAENLNPAAAAKVKDLLSNAPYTVHRSCKDPQMDKIEYFATWADDARTTKNEGWHFWDIPLATDTAAMPAYCGAPALCVVVALQQQVAILKNPASTRAAQQTALQFIIHLVGDAHQPMHIVDNGDRGGNCVPVTFSFTGSKTEKTTQGKDKSGNPNGDYTPNLHHIWDDEVIATMMVPDTAGNPRKDLGESIAAEYSAQIAAEVAKTVDAQTDFAAWALAAHTLAKPDSYEQMPKAIAVNPAPKTLQSCLGVSSKFVGLKETASDPFVKQAQPVIRSQLALAGARLAATLNTVWPGGN